MSIKFVRWMVFSVVLSLVPLLFLWLVNCAFENRDSSIEALVSRGELMLVTAILCAAVVGELIGQDSQEKKTLIFFGGLSVILMIISSFLFSMFAYPDLISEDLSEDFVFSSSVFVYFSALISCSVCVYKVGE